MKGSICRRSASSWTLRFDLPRREDARRRQACIAFKGNKHAAEKELARLIHEVNTGSYVDSSKITLAEYLDQWLDQIRSSVSGKTFERYEQLLASDVIPRIGDRGLQDLRPLHLQSLYRELLDSGRRQSSGGLSARTVLHIHRALHKALGDAVKWQLLLRNPAAIAEPPRVERRERNTLTIEEARTLLEVAKGTQYYLPTLLALTCGLRRGEILALRWADVDFEAGILIVRRSVEETKGGIVFKEPKSGRFRAVRMSAFTMTDLRQAERHGDLICSNENGGPLSPDRFSSNWRHFYERHAKIEKHITFHDLRHTHATLLLTDGMHPKIVSERLGHSTIGITLDLYSHVSAAMQEPAAARMDALFNPSVRKG